MYKPIKQLRFGPYVTPVVVPGAIVECEVRGLVNIVGLSNGPIPWPIGEQDGREEPIVFKSLARAVRQESPTAVAAAWGVNVALAERWKAACGRPQKRKKQTVKTPPIPWKREDDDLLCRSSLSEAARLTGRTLTAVRKRRRLLGLPDGRLATERAARTMPPEEQAAAASEVLRVRTRVLANSLAELHVTFNKAKAKLAFWRSSAQIQPGKTSADMTTG